MSCPKNPNHDINPEVVTPKPETSIQVCDRKYQNKTAKV